MKFVIVGLLTNHQLSATDVTVYLLSQVIQSMMSAPVTDDRGVQPLTPIQSKYEALCISNLDREFYMSASVLLNLLDKWRKQ